MSKQGVDRLSWRLPFLFSIATYTLITVRGLSAQQTNTISTSSLSCDAGSTSKQHKLVKKIFFFSQNFNDPDHQSLIKQHLV